jgi:two-component system, chemotaxis family, protein-glutamate methylesterase/glutaminase
VGEERRCCGYTHERHCRDRRLRWRRRGVGPVNSETGQGIKEYRCRVGHRYSPETYAAAEKETQERTLWAAVVALEEGAEVSRELATKQSESAAKRRYEEEAEDQVQTAAKIRELIAALTKAQADRNRETKPNSGA